MISQLGDKLYLTIITFWSWCYNLNNQQNYLSPTILIISIATLLLIIWYTRSSKPPLPPGPYGLPLLGYLPFLNPNLLETFTQMSHKYGPIFSLRLGTKLHVVVNSMDLVKVVARDLDQTFSHRDPPLAALSITYGGLDVAFASHKHWREMRKLVASQMLSNTNLDASQSFRTNGVRETVKDVYGRIGTEINIRKVACETEMNVITNMIWGCSIGHDDSSDVGEGFREVMFNVMEIMVAPNISDFIPMLSRFDLQGRERDMQKQKDHVDKIFEKIIRGRIDFNSRKKDEKDERKDFLQILLDEKDDPTSSIDINTIKALLTEVVFASVDTTSTIVEWVMAEILYNPRIMTKVQEELTDVIGKNNIVEESHLSKLTYLDTVVKETFRLNPTGPLLLHRCPNESCTVGGYTVPKGTLVYLHILAIHRDPKNWSNPLEFNPERFLNSKWDYKGNNFNFLPFGSGRRMCPGTTLGEKMVKYLAATLLHSFNWSLTKDEDYDLSTEYFGIVMRKKKPFIAIPSPRLSDANLYL